MKRLLLALSIVIASQFALAMETETKISPKCLEKLTNFATYFAQANMMYYGDVIAKVGKVSVEEKAQLIGESGFANVKGSYELIIDDVGQKISGPVGLSMLFVTEPHCAVMKIEIREQ